MKIENLKIISGGQTGVDRAALDAAIEAGVAHGGWCPFGRRSEDGRVPSRYQLQETTSSGYMQRTILNATAANVTLILFWGEPTGGTARTIVMCKNLQREHYTVRLDGPELERFLDIDQAIAPALRRRQGQLTLNVAGPRASKSVGVYPNAKRYMDYLIPRLLQA